MTDIQAEVTPSYQMAFSLIASLQKQGLRQLIICPGSRSAPLAYAAIRLARSEALEIFVRYDERSAGFFALGIIRAAQLRGETRLPTVAVVTTSGSAPAHLYPALLEAEAADLPLIVISADRPAWLQQVKASQTTVQTDLFGRHVRGSWDIPAVEGQNSAASLRSLRGYAAQVGARAYVTSQALWGGTPGPVHINVAFAGQLVPVVQASTNAPLNLAHQESRKAEDNFIHEVYNSLLLPQISDFVAGVKNRQGFSARHMSDFTGDSDNLLVEPSVDPNLLTAVLAGSNAAVQVPDLAQLCFKNRWPLIAEPGSLVREGQAVITPWQLLPIEQLAKVERLVVVGALTLHRLQQTLLSGSLKDAALKEVWVVTNNPDWPDAANAATQVISPDWLRIWQAELPINPQQASWFRFLQAETRRIEENTKQLLYAQPQAKLSLPVLAAQIYSAYIEAKIPVVLGASSVVRDIDRLVRETPQTFTNRGLAGIDGTLAFATGLALGSTRRVAVFCGDVTFAHDAMSLLPGKIEKKPALDVVVLDDAGGSIFAGLEHGEVLNTDDYARIFGVPIGMSFAAMAQLADFSYMRVENMVDLAEVLAVDNEADFQMQKASFRKNRLIHLLGSREETVRWRQALNQCR